jgi:hypothetical protein
MLEALAAFLPVAALLPQFVPEGSRVRLASDAR